MTQLNQIFLIAFGLFTLVGGIMGFVKAKSKASLIVGGLSGILLILAGVLAGQGKPAGLWLGLGLCVLLAARFVPKFLTTRGWMPAGLMALLSIAGAIITGWSVYAL